ncbi:membrane protein [Gordonia phage Ennea]|uniref:Uncharacterized protein n=1 Tax=Gordonia Phage Lollipop1437 TaxID=2588505 RepID=A0A4Y6EK66_9CAUD|nr:hypothetical protein KNU64_gp06 [Gordonia Phage Lollipop1437]QDF19110.1 hypothetical protein SEA_LOLLIPOP1437_6 [Gordonia Phage Lollipop1437]QRI45242.1 membrane protein [Gordonia phage Ennea]
MENETQQAAGTTVSVGLSLLITFVVLRLTDVIDWSWFFVLMPLWAPALMFAILMASAGILMKIKKGARRRESRSRR